MTRAVYQAAPQPVVWLVADAPFEGAGNTMVVIPQRKQVIIAAVRFFMEQGRRSSGLFLSPCR